MDRADLVTQYVDDVGRWVRWQKEYRFGVLLIYPPDPPLQTVNALRAKYDPRSAAGCDAHISLTVPLPGPLTGADWEELETIASGIAPIAIRYGPLMNYLPAAPGVCLAIEPQAELDRLRAVLETASIFAEARPRNHPFSAHMTIAEFISAERTEELMRGLEHVAPQGVFRCDAVSYAVPDADFHFSERRRLPLGR